MNTHNPMKNLLQQRRYEIMKANLARSRGLENIHVSMLKIQECIVENQQELLRNSTEAINTGMMQAMHLGRIAKVAERAFPTPDRTDVKTEQKG